MLTGEGLPVMEVQSGRVEKRLAIAVPIWLTSLKNPGPFEKAVTENVSSVGARIIVGGRREPNESVVLLCSPGCIAQGEVVYAQPLQGEENYFALGVRLQANARGWPGNGDEGAGNSTSAPSPK
jgi:hypothetical protein